jgi:hypothetical protein
MDSLFLHKITDKMFLVEAMATGGTSIELPSDFVQQSFEFHTLITVAIILTWCSMASVKKISLLYA